MKSFRIVAIVTLVCAMVVLTGAQNAAPTPPPTPGAEVKKLDMFAGNWKSEGESKPSPLGPGGKFSETNHNEWMGGGFFLVSHGTETSSEGNGTSLGIFGYDKDKKVYTFDEFSSDGSTVHAKGTVAGDTWTWISEGPMSGRFTVKVLSPTAYTFKFETSKDGSWSTLEEGKATKTK